MDYAATLLSKLPGASRRDHGVRQLVDTLETYLPDDQVKKVLRCLRVRRRRARGPDPQIGRAVHHAPGRRRAGTCAEMHLDAEAIMRGHPARRRRRHARRSKDIEEQFGDDVALLVDGVSKLDQIQFRSRAEAQAESFRKMMLAMIEDIRVILIKLSDRLHNMRTLGAMAARAEKPYCARNARHLRADRKPPRHQSPQGATRRSRLQAPASLPLPRARKCAEEKQGQPEADRAAHLRTVQQGDGGRRHFR